MFQRKNSFHSDVPKSNVLAGQGGFICHFFKSCLLLLSFIMLLLCLPPQTARAEMDPVKFSAFGDMDVAFVGTRGASLDADRKNDNFYVKQRLRVFISAKVSEDLSIHTMFRVKPDRWGDSDTNNSGYAMDGDGNIVLARMIFASWKAYENTVVNMGLIPVALPIGAYRNGILDTSIGGVSINYTWGQGKDIQVLWGRAYDAPERGSGDRHDDADLFLLMLPMNFEEYRAFFAPWGMYASIGKDSNYWEKRVPYAAYDGVSNTELQDNADGIWGGFAARYEIGDFTLKGDFAYGEIKSDKSPGNYNTKGWFAGLKAEYNASFGRPGIYGWYASGSDASDVENKNTWGHLPTISPFNDGFGPTSLGFTGHSGVNPGGLVSYVPSGRWGVVAEVAEISFVEKLRHVVRVAYYEGTNDNKLAGSPQPRQHLSNTGDFLLMVKDDYIIEVNFDHLYQASKRIDVNLGLGYLNIHRSREWGAQRDLDDVYAANLNFTFRF